MRLSRVLSSLFCFVAVVAFALAAQASDYPLANVLPEAAAKKLEAQGVKTTDQLVTRGASMSSRRKLAKKTGLAYSKLTAWVQGADLMRISGVGPEMSRLLTESRVKTVASLKKASAKRLLVNMNVVNKKKKITQNLPGEKLVADWIGQAKKLKVVVR